MSKKKKTKTSIAISATAIIGNDDALKYTMEKNKRIPHCPKCGRILVPIKLAMDFGITREATSIILHKNERLITEQTAWLCEKSCDEHYLVRRYVGLTT